MPSVVLGAISDARERIASSVAYCARSRARSRVAAIPRTLAGRSSSPAKSAW
ncbi:Uncharacterised protein [Mycobacterium tuberculosis]|uniref:Uncharacterized protein n=1 Tax=Mycobacterium tuberculosis TaxID=1773 RepID=A0A916LBA3_MYCTX|nr:Uncharacterised protein [Mycobacterium tuberculosis]